MKRRPGAEETLASFQEMVEKGTRTWRPRIQAAKRWFFRIAAAFFVLLSLPFFLTGEFGGGGILLGIGFFFALAGFLMAARDGPGTYATKKIVLSGIFTLVGMGAIWMGYYFHQQDAASRDWPSVAGTVLRSKIEKTRSTTGTGAGKRTVTKYSPYVQYTYRVDGRSYRSSRIAYGQLEKPASRTVDRYAEGKRVKVYYNPEKPERSVLEPGTDSIRNIVFMAIGAGLVFIGLLSGKSAFQKHRVLAQAGRP